MAVAGAPGDEGGPGRQGGSPGQAGRAAPVGAVVRIFYDGAGLTPGDALRTPTGRTYVVAAVRVQRRGRHVGRQHLACLVAPAGAPVEGRVLPLYWYARG